MTEFALTIPQAGAGRPAHKADKLLQCMHACKLVGPNFSLAYEISLVYYI